MKSLKCFGKKLVTPVPVLDFALPPVCISLLLKLYFDGGFSSCQVVIILSAD